MRKDPVWFKPRHSLSLYYKQTAAHYFSHKSFSWQKFLFAMLSFMNQGNKLIAHMFGILTLGSYQELHSTLSTPRGELSPHSSCCCCCCREQTQGSHFGQPETLKTHPKFLPRWQRKGLPQPCVGFLILPFSVALQERWEERWAKARPGVWRSIQKIFFSPNKVSHDSTQTLSTIHPRSSHAALHPWIWTQEKKKKEGKK